MRVRVRSQCQSNETVSLLPRELLESTTQKSSRSFAQEIRFQAPLTHYSNQLCSFIMCDICVPFVRHVLMRCGLLRGPLSNVEKDSKFTSSRLSDVSY